jgi:hypothetical protein
MIDSHNAAVDAEEALAEKQVAARIAALRAQGPSELPPKRPPRPKAYLIQRHF